MYSTKPGLILGFHGCDEKVAKKIVNEESDIKPSDHSYDWLGNGVYFWDGSPERALEWAIFLKDHQRQEIENPAVLGAVLDLGYCFDLLNYGMLQLLKTSYNNFKSIFEKTGKILPENRKVGNSEDLLLRELDCAVFETLHHLREENGERPFDSVRGVFWEGPELYPTAGFREKDHIQICIRNPNCIKGFFFPREFNRTYQAV